MQAWIDNTGLHGAGRCLAGEAQRAEDIRGLFQFATLIVFCETLSFGDYEVDAVAGISAGYRSTILALGLDQAVLGSTHITGSQYEEACTAAADLAAEEWVSHFQRSLVEGFSASFDVPKGVRPAANWIPGSVRANWQDVDPMSARERKAAGAVEFMLASSKPLRRAVETTVWFTPTWDVAEGYLLESFLRSILNDQLARQHGATYLPAPTRAEQLRFEGELIASEIADRLSESGLTWKPDFPTLPRLTLTLLRRARGDPQGLISEALELRSRTAWLRKHLSNRAAALRENPTAYSGERPDELKRYVRSALGMEDAPRLADALQVQFVVGLPSVALEAGKLYDWAMHNLWKRRLVGFTELASSRSLDGLDEPILKTLVSKSMGRPFTPD